jgi:thiol-disulfide isomerase/thioredoxin
MRQHSIALMGVTVLVSALCLGAGKAPGVPELSAQQILARTAENYRGVTGYAFTGSVATHMVIQDQVQDIMNTIVVAYGGPGRSRFEADTPSDRTVLVNAGDSTFTYSSSLGQYSVQPATVQPAVSGMPALDPTAAHPLAGYARLADHVSEARLVGRDTATVNGRTIPTFVLDVQYDTTVAPTSPSGAAQKPKRLTIDAKDFLVVGDETSLERSHPALPKPIQIEQRARFTSASWNVAPPDSMFAFNAPPGAVRVIRVGEPAGAATEEDESAFTGKPADDFTLPDLKGVKRVLSSHRGKVVLLDFWATWCGPCRREMPIIAKLNERYAKRGLVVYGVNCSEPHAKAKAFVDKYGYTFPMLLDRDGSVQTRYQITAIPTVFIVDKKGTVSAHMIGGRSEEELVAALGRAGLNISP